MLDEIVGTNYTAKMIDIGGNFKPNLSVQENLLNPDFTANKPNKKYFRPIIKKELIYLITTRRMNKLQIASSSILKYSTKKSAFTRLSTIVHQMILHASFLHGCHKARE